MCQPAKGVIQVTKGVEQLYELVNSSDAAGYALVLTPGPYTLSVNDVNDNRRPNGGRLDLQPDMSIYGLVGDRAAVVIDASGLNPSVTNVPVVDRTGPIRTGQGCNAVEWLTVIGPSLAAAGIVTDLVEIDPKLGTPQPTTIRVAHVLSRGSFRGVDVRNIGTAATGRRIDVEIDDNEFPSASRQGIRIANFDGAHSAQIFAVMNCNYSHGNAETGCLVVNNGVDGAVIHVRSNGDRFEDNKTGCSIFGGIVSQAVTANDNSITFEAHRTKFINNTDRGFFVVGGEAPGFPSATSRNTVMLRLWDCPFSGNQIRDFEAFGARNFDPLARLKDVAGMNNTVTIERYGTSQSVSVEATDSLPSGPAGHGNSVTVL